VVAGERIHLLVCGLPSGAVVRITLNGREIARFTVGDVPPNACKSRGLVLGPARGSSFVLAAAGPVGHGLTARRTVLAQAETLSGIDDFVTIPADTAPGVYPFCAETPGADTACVPLRVLAPGSSPLFSSSGNNNSFLAFT